MNKKAKKIKKEDNVLEHIKEIERAFKQKLLTEVLYERGITKKCVNSKRGGVPFR